MLDTGAKVVSHVSSEGETFESYPVREIELGGIKVSRALPVREHRLVGPWCFLDRFGPLSFGNEKPMDVAPHPHMGLQTVTWLLEGEVLHDDSLNCEAVGRPGTVNVMTSGRAIAHAEQTPRSHTGKLNGVQLWVALEEKDRNMDPSFQHVAEVPTNDRNGVITRVFAGDFNGLNSPAVHYSPIVGADIEMSKNALSGFDLNPAFEHALLILDGDCTLDGKILEQNSLHYLGSNRSAAELASSSGGRVLLLGGAAFPEKILMWWNFVARTPEEIADARDDWEAGRRFGPVKAYNGPRLAAPDLGRFARPNPAS